MDLSSTPVSPTRHDGWTPARKAQFLEALAQDGNVRAACARVGMSREAAYQLRRREPLFARAWAAAHLLARENVGEVLGTRAIEGVAEEIWYRGEVVGTRRRFDTRLLLAHMARLDRLAAADQRAQADADRFDELLARVAGMELPVDLASSGDQDLPAPQAAYVQAACDEADRKEHAAFGEFERKRSEAGKGAYIDEDDPEWVAFEAEAAAAWEKAFTGASGAWEAWFDDACALVDRLLGEPTAIRPQSP